MSIYQPLIGFQPIPGTLQAPLGSVSKAVETIAEEFALDPTLPELGTIMTDGRPTYVVVPKFRAVGVMARYAYSNMAGDRPTLTIAGPLVSNPDPLGCAQFDFYKEYNNVPLGMMSVFEKRQYIRFPFVNNAAGVETGVYNSNLNGNLYEGCSVAPDVFGRPVLYQEAVNVTSIGQWESAATSFTAISGGCQYIPVNSLSVIDMTKGAAIPSTAITAAWDVSGANYKLTIAAGAYVTAGDILLITTNYGHKATKKYGKICRLVTGIDENSLAGFIRNAVNNDFPYAPIMNPVFTAQQTDLIRLTSLNGTYNLTWKYIDIYKSLVVSFCSDVDVNGNPQNGQSWSVLANASSPMLYVQTELGAEFALSGLQGTIDLFLSSTRDLSHNPAIQVSYSYKIAQPRAQFEMGAYGNQGTGIFGISDGTVPGTIPAMKPAPAVHVDGAGFRTMTAAQIALSGVMQIMTD